MGRRAKFSKEQDAQIAELYLSGKTMQEITVIVGTGRPSERTAVRNSLVRTGTPTRPRSSPRPPNKWVWCACGRRAAYRTGQCDRCYNVTRNAEPDVKERKFNWWLSTMYGMTRETYDGMLAAQGGVCAVCLGPDPRGHRLAVDHDGACCPGLKSCGRCVCGLLCVKCNRAKGLLKDSADNAGRLLAYLQRGPVHRVLATKVAEAV